MVSRLTKAMGALTQNDEEDAAAARAAPPPQERRKSARLNKMAAAAAAAAEEPKEPTKEKEPVPHDSGTESDEEELQNINRFDPLGCLRDYDDYLHENPPRVSASPAWKRDRDETESWDSFGRESGIMTGDNDSDTDGFTTPTPARRRLRDVDSCSPSPGKRGHEETNPMADHPIAWRLRSFNNERAMKVAARRCPVQVLIMRPPVPAAYRFDRVEQEVESVELMPPAPAPKRGRRNSHRPSLDFEKMVQTRIEEPSTSSSSASTITTTSSSSSSNSSSSSTVTPTSSGPVTRSQINQ